MPYPMHMKLLIQAAPGSMLQPLLQGLVQRKRQQAGICHPGHRGTCGAFLQQLHSNSRSGPWEAGEHHLRAAEGKPLLPMTMWAGEALGRVCVYTLHWARQDPSAARTGSALEVQGCTGSAAWAFHVNIKRPQDRF